MQRYQGINLFELMIALAIIAILVLIGIPTYTSIIQTQRLIGTTENLYFSLQYARGEAIKRNTPVVVSFQTGSNWCYGINPTTACNCNTPASCSLGAVSAPNDQLTLSATNFGTQFQFDSVHGAANTSGTLTFTLSGETKDMTVKVGRLGSLQVCSSQISGYQPCS